MADTAMPLPMNPGTPLWHAARKSAGLSQTEPAKRPDLSQRRMSAMEVDPVSMDLDQQIVICASLKLELILQTKDASCQDQNIQATQKC